MDMRKTRPPREEHDRLQRTARRLPVLMALVFGTMWALVYLLIGRLHDMWAMFDREFPFVVLTLLGARKATITPWEGMLFAFIDGAVIAFTVSFGFGFLVKRGGNQERKPRRVAMGVLAVFFLLFVLVARGCLD